MKNNKLTCVLISIFVVIIVFVICYNTYKWHIELEYIAESDYSKIDVGVDLFELYQLPENCQVTWFGYYPKIDKKTITAINENYGANFAENVLEIINSKKETNEMSCFISIGRKLKMVYYGSERYATGSYYDEILSCPIFDKKYDHKIYLYVTNKTYHMMGEPELLGEYMERFNIEGDVPFDEDWYKNDR